MQALFICRLLQIQALSDSSSSRFTRIKIKALKVSGSLKCSIFVDERLFSDVGSFVSRLLQMQVIFRCRLFLDAESVRFRLVQI